MREKYLWLAVAVLTALTMGQACYIYEGKAVAKDITEQPPVEPEIHRMAHTEKASDSRWEELEKWRRTVREQINQGFPLSDRDFDVFFGDSFFAGRPGPFAEMERVRKQMSGQFRDREKTLFDGYWGKWFEQRMLMGQFRTEITRTPGEVTVTVQVPGLEGRTADVSVTEERIRLSFEAKASSAKKTADTMVKRASSQSYLKILPLPEDAVPGTGKVEIKGETVSIRFARKKS